MSDLINKQDIIGLIRSMYPSMPIFPSSRKKWAEKYEPFIRVEREISNLPSVQPEVTEDEVKEYCRKRCLTVMTNDCFYKLTSTQPEIIRCKECKYAQPNGKYGCTAYHFKLYETHEMGADDFCSRAERRK